MSELKPEFDGLSDAYEELLKDPLRDRFTGGASEFFHIRKRDLIREFFRARHVDTQKLSFLDMGCGKGELLASLRTDFAEVFGCDPSPGMLAAGGLKQKELKHACSTIPEGSLRRRAVRLHHRRSAYTITSLRIFAPDLTAEVRRVLKPGGWFAIIEHNPYNPVTRLIVSRTPMDAGAILLRPSETRRLLRDSGFRIDAQRYFLYCPERFYRQFGGLESALGAHPFGRTVRGLRHSR